jgi:hypothetical protein
LTVSSLILADGLLCSLHVEPQKAL